MTSIIETYENGVQIDDPVTDGIFTLTRDHLLSVVSGSKDSVMAYAGQFEVKGGILQIAITACNRRNLESSTIERKIDVLNPDQLVISMKSVDEKVNAVVYWKKIVAL